MKYIFLVFNFLISMVLLLEMIENDMVLLLLYFIYDTLLVLFQFICLFFLFLDAETYAMPQGHCFL